MMKLWILRPVDSANDRWTYDCAFGFVVRACNEADARRIAFGNQGAEGYDRAYLKAEGHSPWVDPSKTTCSELLPEGEEALIMMDFHAG